MAMDGCSTAVGLIHIGDTEKKKKKKQHFSVKKMGPAIVPWVHWVHKNNSFRSAVSFQNRASSAEIKGKSNFRDAACFIWNLLPLVGYSKWIRVQIRGEELCRWMVLVDTERNAQGAQLQNASACTFFSATK